MSKLAKSLVLAAAVAAVAAPVSAADVYRHAPRADVYVLRAHDAYAKDVMHPGEAMRPGDALRHGPRGDVFVRRPHSSAYWN
jgi:hypothetical protein